MPNETKKTKRTPEMGEREDLGAFVAFNGVAAETFMKSCQAYSDRAATMNAEVMSFINGRLTRGIEFSETVCRCKNWADVVSLQQRWAREATEEYLSEARKLTELAANLTTESWEPLIEQAGQTIADLNKPLS